MVAKMRRRSEEWGTFRVLSPQPGHAVHASDDCRLPDFTSKLSIDEIQSPDNQQHPKETDHTVLQNLWGHRIEKLRNMLAVKGWDYIYGRNTVELLRGTGGIQNVKLQFAWYHDGLFHALMKNRCAFWCNFMDGAGQCEGAIAQWPPHVYATGSMLPLPPPEVMDKNPLFVPYYVKHV